MLDNTIIIDRKRWDNLNQKGLMMLLDFVVIKELDGTYSMIKNRHNGTEYLNMNRDDADMTIRAMEIFSP